MNRTEFLKKHGQEFESREMWLDFETWLYKNYNVTLPDLSWNTYIEYSKEYNSERILGRNTEINVDLEYNSKQEKGIAND
jgi:hypothetical protein